MSNKQPLKKKLVTGSSFAEYKKMKNFSSTKASSADKELEWLVMPQAYQDVLKLPGIPMGYITTVLGHSNTGKSTLINHAIVAAQKRGVIPVIYDTENNFDFTYARDMGMDATPIYGDVVDEETGEVKNAIIDWEGEFLYFNNKKLAELYGIHNHLKGVDNAKPRKEAVIEDIAYSITELIEDQEDGKVDAGFLFIWDSVGSIRSQKSLDSKVGNNMFDAGSISTAFNSIFNSKIPSSRKVSEPYTNTMIIVNKVWMDSMTSPMAPPSIKQKGGNSLVYAQRLSILMGGQLGASVKKLTAVSKGCTYQYATQTKIRVMKNQLPAPFTMSYEGELVCTPTGFIGADKESIEAYRKEKGQEILKKLNEIASEKAISIDDNIEFKEEEGQD